MWEKKVGKKLERKMQKECEKRNCEKEVRRITEKREWETKVRK